MTAVRTVGASASDAPKVRVSILAMVVPFATAIAILGVALLPLLTPFVIHPLLDAASSSAWLGLTPGQAHELSDRSVSELVFGPGSFSFVGPDGAPFYTAQEASHLRDARMLLLLFEGLAIGSLVLVGWAAVRGSVAKGISRGATGLIVGTLIVGIGGFLAFEPIFTLFHEVVFPGGNWAFDPNSSHLVQLYPELFWELVSAALGGTAIVIALVVRSLARRRLSSGA